MTQVEQAEKPERLSLEELREVWPVLSPEERVEAFRLLAPDDAEEFFLSLSTRGQAIVLLGLPKGECRIWIRQLPPDDVADLIQEVPPERRLDLLSLLDAPTRREADALLAYAEDVAGGLMNPRFARLRLDMTVDQAISYVRRQTRDVETLYYLYVLDQDQVLRGVISFRDLLTAPGGKLVKEAMSDEVIAVPESMDQEAVARVISREDLMAVPVVDEAGRMKGIVTVDDVVDVVQEEATEDIQKMGGQEALETPYLQAGLGAMVRKRGVWLCALFLGEMLTTHAMGHFESDIASMVVLATFIPLIISSGGNSGSQATTLVIRAMALGEVRLRDWGRVFGRELAAGLCLGLILAAIGLVRVVAWEGAFGTYGEISLRLGLTVAASLVCVVTWGTLTGSMLPFLLRRLGFDPASASAPFVATLVDVFGLVIYFSTAQALLSGFAPV